MLSQQFKGVWYLDSSTFAYWNGALCNAYDFTFKYADDNTLELIYKKALWL